MCRNQGWELAALGEKETPLQKYYRLKLETEELVQDIKSLQVNFVLSIDLYFLIGYLICIY